MPIRHFLVWGLATTSALVMAQESAAQYEVFVRAHTHDCCKGLDPQMIEEHTGQTSLTAAVQDSHAGSDVMARAYGGFNYVSVRETAVASPPHSAAMSADGGASWTDTLYFHRLGTPVDDGTVKLTAYFNGSTIAFGEGGASAGGSLAAGQPFSSFAQFNVTNQDGVTHTKSLNVAVMDNLKNGISVRLGLNASAGGTDTSGPGSADSNFTGRIVDVTYLTPAGELDPSVVITSASGTMYTQAIGPTVNYDSTFDYPGAGNSTTPHSISNNGNVVGFYIDTNNVRRGFQRSEDGTFSPPLVHPDDTDNFSQARGINNDGLIVGSYRTPNQLHGLILDDGVYSTYDFGGPVSTEFYAVNDAGDAVGAYGSFVQPNIGLYLPHGGSAVNIQPPDSTRVFAYGINNNGQIVGQFDDPDGKVYGYLRQANGSYSTIDYPDATLTTARSINDLGWISGFYQNADGSFHGYVLIDGVFINIDQPLGKDTRAMAVNNDGVIIGDFLDSPSGTLRHGFMAQIPIGDLPGDYNDDDVVDAADYVVWQDNRSLLLTLPNDLTPGSVTIGDYNVWRANFGRTAGSGSLSDIPVPEPASGLLLVIAGVAVGVRRQALRV